MNAPPKSVPIRRSRAQWRRQVRAGCGCQPAAAVFGLVAILILVSIIFQILTGGTFLSARNLTNLSGQVAITAILTAGIVLV